jgi:hypothetical protein
MTDLITLPRATVQQALEALENSSPDQYPEDAGVFYDAKDALRAALEKPEPEQEPDLRTAAQQALEALEARAVNRYFEHLGETITALRAALEQTVQEPLSDEELDRLWREPMSADWEHREYGRAIEAAHGIKEKT